MKFYLAPFFGFLLAASVLADGKSEAAYQKELFEAVDVNKDRKVTEREFVVTVLYDTFMSYADKDGRVSRKTYFKWVKQYPEIDARREYAMMDTEGKGYLIPSDVLRNTIAIKEMEKDFRKLDKKNKGYITMKDLPNLKDANSKPSK